MGVLDTIISAVRSLTSGGTGTSADSDSDGHREGQVSVEHDPDEDPAAVDASAEAAVKGTGSGPSAGPESDSADGGGSDENGDNDDVAAAGTDATSASGTLEETAGEAGSVDVDRTSNETDRDVAGDDEHEDHAGDTDDAGATLDDPDDADSEADAVGESVETIKGIGPAYAGRLEPVGIETVGELAAADATAVAEEIDVSESRVGDWIERARDAS